MFQLYSIKYLGEVLDSSIMTNLITETKVATESISSLGSLASPSKRKRKKIDFKS